MVGGVVFASGAYLLVARPPRWLRSLTARLSTDDAQSASTGQGPRNLAVLAACGGRRARRLEESGIRWLLRSVLFVAASLAGIGWLRFIAG